jgi:hypothetical protein
MVINANPTIRIDLNEFKLHINLKKGTELTLHFNSPSRMFYLSVIALVVNEMKKSGKITAIPLERHLDLLALLNESVGESAGSSDKKKVGIPFPQVAPMGCVSPVSSLGHALLFFCRELVVY